MRTTHWLMTAVLGILLTGCAGMHTAPTPEARQALAPTGKLRVALWLGSPAHVVKDSGSGEMKGVGHDLGKELAARLGVPFEPVLYSAIGPLLDGAKGGAWDVAFVGVNPERGKFLDFTGNHIEIEFGYLVPPGSPIKAMADVDRPGVRVVVPERGSADVFLTRSLKSATVLRATGLTGSLALVKSGKADVFAANKSNLYEISGQLPGSRVLDGRPGSEEQAMAMPKGRTPGVAYARKFIEEAKAGGLVKAAIDRAGLRGAVVAPRE
jgi:polar amino acid transport system substrate-binding protein